MSNSAQKNFPASPENWVRAYHQETAEYDFEAYNRKILQKIHLSNLKVATEYEQKQPRSVTWKKHLELAEEPLIGILKTNDKQIYNRDSSPIKQTSVAQALNEMA